MKKKQGKRVVDLKSMDVDEFMNASLSESDDSFDEDGNKEPAPSAHDGDPESSEKGESEDDSDDGNDEDEEGENNEEQEDEDDEKIVENFKADSVGGDEEEEDEEKDSEDEGNWTSKNFSHKKALMKLKDTDPEFFKYLQENDKELLEFEDSGSDDEDRGGKVHKLPDSLEVGSDESDYEDKDKDGDEEELSEDDGKGVRTVTLKLVKEWEEKLQKISVKNNRPIKDVIQGFRAVVARVSSEDDTEARFKITGSGVFNAVIQLCVLELQPALRKYLRMHAVHIAPTRNKEQWTKVQRNIRFYLSNLIKLLGAVSSPHILAVMLKHLHQMMPFAACFSVLRQPLLKMLVNLWSSGEDTVRIVSFLCLLKLTTLEQDKILERVLKMMYLAYVRNSKFVSPSTLYAINFMRRSLVEMFGLDLGLAYQHVFLYIRQLAIHLRNAITLQKKEHMQAVYNWQFVNSVHLWADLLGATAGKAQLQPLLYPLIQVTLGTIKLIPTSQYYPLRFHCVQILINLSKKTCTYIPVLPFLMEVLESFDFNKAHKKVSMKPMDFKCILRLSKVQLQENSFRDAVIDRIYNLMLEYLASEAHSIAFPDLVIPVVMQLKKFLKSCKVSNHCRKMKQVLDKILENARCVENERSRVSFKLSDQKAIAAWETQLQIKGTPLMKFYAAWSEMHATQEAKKQTQNEKLGDFNLPVLKKRPRDVKQEDEGPVKLLPSDESDSEPDNILKSEDKDDEPKSKRKRGKRGGKGKKLIAKKSVITEAEMPDPEDHGDIVEDLTLESLEKT